MMAALEGTPDLGIRFDGTAPGPAAPGPSHSGPSNCPARPAPSPRPGRRAQDQHPHPPPRPGPVGRRGAPGWRPRASTSSAAPAAWSSPGLVAVGDRTIEADTVLIATGARPRELEDAVPDGERLLTSRQIYDLDELPPELIVVGSGVTGAEFASAFQALGSQVTLVSSREHVLPNEDTDAAMVVEDVFRRRGMRVLGRSRAQSARRTANGVEVTLADGREGSRQPLPADRRHGAAHRGPGSRPGQGRGRRARLRQGRPGVQDLALPASTRPATAPAC